MAYFPVNTNAPGAPEVKELKTILVRAKAIAEQMERQTAAMTEAEIQTRYGIAATSVQWNPVLSGVVAVLNDPDVITYIESLGG